MRGEPFQSVLITVTPSNFLHSLTNLLSVTNNLSDGLRSVIMASVGRTCPVRIKMSEYSISALVGAMFYISPQLIVLMLAVVPPVSLGAVSDVFTLLFT